MMKVHQYLWLWQHIQTPRAEFTIRRKGDEIMSVLGSNHLYTVYWMLNENKTMNFVIIYIKSNGEQCSSLFQ